MTLDAMDVARKTGTEPFHAGGTSLVVSDGDERFVMRGWVRRAGPFRIEEQQTINPFTRTPLLLRHFVDDSEPDPSPAAVPVPRYEHQRVGETMVWKWMEEGRLASLAHAALGVSVTDATMMVKQLALVGPPNPGGQLCEVPPVLIETLAQADDARIVQVTLKYAECEHDQWPDSLLDVVSQLCSFSRRAVAQGMRVYLWTPYEEWSPPAGYRPWRRRKARRR